MTTENPFDGMETPPISAHTKQAISKADEVMREANLPTYTDLVNGLQKLSTKATGFHPVKVDWLIKHIGPLMPK
jgi:hypothetical protein